MSITTFPITTSALGSLGAADAAAIKNYVVVDNDVAPSFRKTITIQRSASTDPMLAQAVPWQIECGYSDFSNLGGAQPQWDPVMAVGYNVDTSLGRKDATKPSLGFWLEADYWNGNARWAEMYMQYIRPDTGFTIRPFFAAVDRTTHKVVNTTIEVPDNNALTFIRGDGATSNGNLSGVADLAPNEFNLWAQNTAAATRLYIRGKNKAGTGAQGGILYLGHGTTDTAFAIQPATPEITDLHLGSGYLRAARIQRVGGGGGSDPYTVAWAFGSGETGNDAIVTINQTQGWPGSIALLIKRNASASAKAFEIRESNGTTSRFSIDGNWNIELGRQAALAGDATGGFPYIPTITPGSNALPTGAPTVKTGLAPIGVDETNNRIVVRIGTTWRYVNLTT